MDGTIVKAGFLLLVAGGAILFNSNAFTVIKRIPSYFAKKRALKRAKTFEPEKANFC